MEIIHLVLGKANPQRMNGVNKVVFELATNQANAGMDVQVWGIAKDTDHNYPVRDFTTRIFQKKINPFGIDSELKKAIVSKKNKAVFHLHGGFIPVFYAASQWMKLHSIPFITMTHGAYNTLAMQKSRLIKKMYFRFFERKLLDAADFIHCIGKSEMQGLDNIYKCNKQVLVPYGFSTSVMGNAEVQKADIFTIGFCGRLDVYTKGLNELLEGFCVFKQQVPGARLWLIGDSEERSQLVYKAKQLGIGEAVVFYGARFGDEKIRLLQQCHAFATTSRNEGLPAAVLEAAALGIPCLVTTATNMAEAIAQYDAGVTVQQVDGNEIFNGLMLLYKKIKHPSDYEIISNNATEMVRRSFNWNLALERLDIVYRSAFAKQSTGTASLLPYALGIA